MKFGALVRASVRKDLILTTDLGKVLSTAPVGKELYLQTENKMGKDDFITFITEDLEITGKFTVEDIVFLTDFIEEHKQ